METVQVAIANTVYAGALRELLVRNGAFKVLFVDRPDLGREGVMVLDSEHLELLPIPLPDPERIVLIARNDPQSLTRAWEAGVNSVVFDKDPLNTAVLAILSARLRIARPKRSEGASDPDGPAGAAGSDAQDSSRAGERRS
jgi:hypothetical protein